MQSIQIPQNGLLDFIMAGKAIFTAKSLKTDKHFTFKVKAAKEQNSGKIWWVSVLTGTNNSSDYTYLGLIKVEGTQIQYLHSSKSIISIESHSNKGFQYIFDNIKVGRKVNNLELWHEGKCCRCGRKLTTPESVQKGIGPECASMIPLFSSKKQIG